MLPQMLDHIIRTFFPAIWRAPAGSLREVRCLQVLPQDCLPEQQRCQFTLEDVISPVRQACSRLPWECR